MGLADIAPAEVVARQIEIRGETLTVRGVKNKEWVVLLERFPEVAKLLNGQNMSMMEIYSSAVDGVIPAIIATGLGNCGDQNTETLIADRLSEAEQFALFEVVMEMGAAETEEARKKINPLRRSPQTGGQQPQPLPVAPNGEDRLKTTTQEPLSP